MQPIKHPSKLGDRFGEPDAFELSLVVLFEGWPSDLTRLHASAAAQVRGSWELVVVDNSLDEAGSEHIAALDGVLHLPLRDRLGFGAGRNLGLRQATGELVCVIDTSVELTGDVLAPLRGWLSDPAVGLVGRWGVSSTDAFAFEEAEGPDVDAVEAYLMTMRRADVGRMGMFDPKFRFYRNADLDLSFKVRDTGLRTVVDPALPVVRHEHRIWESTPADEREALSRKNFFRFRDRWGERRDLFSSLET